MRRFMATGALMVLVFLMIQGSAAADAIWNWTDNTLYWMGYGKGAWTSNDSTDNTKNTIGSPDILGGTVDVSNAGYLESITYTYTGWNISGLYPGDLFLDTNSDGTWDYVLSLGYTHGDSYNSYTPSGTPKLYQITSFNVANYLITADPGTYGYWNGYNIRNDHPYAYDTTGSVFLGTGSESIGTYTLPDNKILFTGTLTFGFTENCANDVVLQTVTGPYDYHIPEPGTILLLGTGLIGVAVFGKKKLNKK